MSLPESFIMQMQRLLGAEITVFLTALQTSSPTSIRHNQHKANLPEIISFSQPESVPWCKNGYYLASRPSFTLDPLLHAGTYYVQEASSMFLAHIVRFLFPKASLTCLDLCAAPGGKSTLLSDFLPAESLVVANEIITSRTAILCETLTKWGNPNTVITHNDPKGYAALPHFFDVMLIDAPCSGEGMFRKDPAAINEWSLAHVQLCAERQRRIVADAWDALRPDGILLYSTCTYNREENEENIRWIMETLGAEQIRIAVDPTWNITESDYGYRFYPHKTKGEGFYICALRKINKVLRTASKANTKAHRTKQPETSLQIPEEIKNWIFGNVSFIREQGKVIALPAIHRQKINLLHQQLHVWQAGITLAEIKGKDIVPDIALALSTSLNKNIFPSIDVDLTTALHYLRREQISLPDACSGFILITYKNQPLGFVKNIGSRINNLYPKNWRIRMSFG